MVKPVKSPIFPPPTLGWPSTVILTSPSTYKRDLRQYIYIQQLQPMKSSSVKVDVDHLKFQLVFHGWWSEVVSIQYFMYNSLHFFFAPAPGLYWMLGAHFSLYFWYSSAGWTCSRPSGSPPGWIRIHQRDLYRPLGRERRCRRGGRRGQQGCTWPVELNIIFAYAG